MIYIVLSSCLLTQVILNISLILKNFTENISKTVMSHLILVYMYV